VSEYFCFNAFELFYFWDFEDTLMAHEKNEQNPIKYLMTQFYKDKLLSRYVGISLRRLVREKLN
jgi:hypothetical protein